MSLQSIAQPDIAKVHAMLSKMDGPQLQQFAAANQDNAIYVSLAMQVDKDRKADMQRLQALMTGQKQPNVMQQVVAALNPQGMIPPGMGGQGGAPMPPPGGPQAPMPPQGMPMGMPPPGMQMPPPMPPAPQMPPPSGPSAAPQGLAGLPAQNIQNMADGGIAGYADEDEAVGYADGGAIRMAAGTPESMFDNVSEEDMRARGRAYGISEDAIDRFIQNRKGTVNASQRNLPYTPATPGAVGAPQITGTPLTGSELWAGQEPMGSFIARGIRNLLPGGEREEYDIAANRARELPIAQAAVQQQRDIRRPPRNVAAPSAEEYAAGRPIYGDATMPMPAAPATPVVQPPPQTYADFVKTLGGGPRLTTGAGVGAGTGARKVATPSIAGIDSLIPEGATVGKTPEQAIEAAGKFSLLPEYIEGQTLLNRAGELRDRETLELFKTRPSKEVGQKAEAYIKEQRGELEREKGERGAHFLISAGLAMASGTSRNAMQNIAQGLQVGVKDAQAAMKDFKAAKKDLARMEADLESLRDAQKERDFDREFALKQRIADRDESRKQSMLDGSLRLAGGDRALAGNIYSLAEQTADQWKRTKAQLGFQRGEREAGQAFTREENAANRAASAANTQAQIEAQKQAAIIAASMPSAQAKFFAELGGALPGTVPTSAQISAGFERANSVNDVETAMLAYEKLRNERAKMMATNPMVQIEPLPDQNTWLKQFMEQKRAFNKLNQGLYSGINVTNTPGNAPVYGR
jgi:hypothetical protein